MKHSAIAEHRRRRRSGPPIRGLLLVLAGLALLALAARAYDGGHGLASAVSAVGSGASAMITAVKPASDSHAVAVNARDLPGGMAPGTCIEYDPTAGNRHQAVFVDPGHGGPDPGSVGVNGLQEKDLTLSVGLRLRDLLRASGFQVVMSRVTDTSVARLSGGQVVNGAITAGAAHVDTVARIDCANSSGAAALVSIHFNAFSDPSASGQEIFYDDARSFAADNQRLASALDASLQASFTASGWQVFDRGVLSDADTGNSGLTAAADAYGRLMEIGPAQAGWNNHPTTMPGALVEPFFISDPVEAEVSSSAQGQQAIATGLERGLAAFLAPPATASPSPAAP